MDKGFFVFDGIDSRDLGIVFCDEPVISAPEPVTKSTKIPGRNGNIVVFDGSYENRTITIPCYILKDYADAALTQVQKWAVNADKYRKIELSNDPDHYMNARLSAGAVRELRVGIMVPFDLVFDCAPQRFLKNVAPIDITENFQSFYNPGLETAPIIELRGDEQPLELSINETKIELTIMPGYPWVTIIDCEAMSAVIINENTGESYSIDHGVYARVFPTLTQGENIATFSAQPGTARIIIRPRWWTL